MLHTGSNVHPYSSIFEVSPIFNEKALFSQTGNHVHTIELSPSQLMAPLNGEDLEWHSIPICMPCIMLHLQTLHTSTLLEMRCSCLSFTAKPCSGMETGLPGSNKQGTIIITHQRMTTLFHKGQGVRTHSSK